MRRILFLLSLLLLFSGCFETNFNFKTIIHRNGKVDREVQINGRGADRFLPPSGPEWEIKTSSTKGGQSILEDIHYHIHATGHFAGAERVSGDFRYDVSKLIENLTDESRSEFREVLGIPEPFEESIGTNNQVELKHRRSLFTTEYEYTEAFQIRRLIPILLEDLKKEIVREQTVRLTSQANPESTGQPAETSAVLETALISPERAGELAKAKMAEEILPKFLFHSEVTLPGKIVSTNATGVHGKTAVWDFKGSDFEDEFSRYTIHVTSKAYNIELMIAAMLAVLAVIWAFGISRRRRSRRRRS